MSSDCDKNISGYKISLVIILIITVLLSGFCAVWTFIGLKSEANDHEKELNDITAKIKGYYSSAFPDRTASSSFIDGDSDGEESIPTITASEMLSELMSETHNLSTARTALQTKNDEIRASKARIDEDLEALRKSFKQSFRQEISNEAFLRLKNDLDSLNQRITSYETEKKRIENDYQQLTSKIKTLELLINDLFLSCGGRDANLSNTQKVQFIKEFLSQQRNKIQTLETEKREQERQIPPTKKDTPKKTVSKNAHHLLFDPSLCQVRCSVKTKNGNFSSGTTSVTDVEFVFQEQIEYEYDAKRQRVSCFYYKTRPLQYFVAKQYIKDGYVNTTTDPLKVRTSTRMEEHNVFLLLPSGARVQQKMNRDVEDGWMEIQIPTDDIFFIIEQ